MTTESKGLILVSIIAALAIFSWWLWNDRNAYIEKLEVIMTNKTESENYEIKRLKETIKSLTSYGAPVPEWVWEDFRELEICSIELSDGKLTVMNYKRFQEFADKLERGYPFWANGENISRIYIEDESFDDDKVTDDIYGVHISGSDIHRSWR